MNTVLLQFQRLFVTNLYLSKKYEKALFKKMSNAATGHISFALNINSNSVKDFRDTKNCKNSDCSESGRS